MGKVTKENMKGMEGTEFKFIHRDGDIHNAFVAAVDIEKGMTLKSFDVELTEDDKKLIRKPDELWCVDIKSMSRPGQSNSVDELIDGMVVDLEIIRTTLKLDEDEALMRFRNGGPIGSGGGGCAF